MTRLVCLEPAAPGPAWQPFAGSRPIAELRAGAWRIRDRWAGILGLEHTVVMGHHIAHFADVDSAPVIPPGTVSGPAVVARSDFAPAGGGLTLEPGVRRITHEDATVAWIVAEGEEWDGPNERGPSVPVDGLLLRGAWDLIAAIEQLLPGDCADALAAGPDPVPDGVIVLGDPGDVASFGAAVEPGVLVLARFADGTLAVKRVAHPATTGSGRPGWFLLSDNAGAGVDSRHRGPVPVEDVLAVVRLRVWPRPGRIRRP